MTHLGYAPGGAYSDEIKHVKDEYKRRRSVFDKQDELRRMRDEAFDPPIYDEEDLEKLKGLKDSGSISESKQLAESLGMNPYSEDAEGLFGSYIDAMDKELEDSKEEVARVGIPVVFDEDQFKTFRPGKGGGITLEPSKDEENKIRERLSQVLLSLGIESDFSNALFGQSTFSQGKGLLFEKIKLRFPLFGDANASIYVSDSGGLMHSKLTFHISPSSKDWLNIGPKGRYSRKFNKHFVDHKEDGIKGLEFSILGLTIRLDLFSNPDSRLYFADWDHQLGWYYMNSKRERASKGSAGISRKHNDYDWLLNINFADLENRHEESGYGTSVARELNGKASPQTGFEIGKALYNIVYKLDHDYGLQNDSPASKQQEGSFGSPEYFKERGDSLMEEFYENKKKISEG